MESFLIELKEYIVPEIVDAYLSADKDELKQWMSEAVSRTLTFVADPVAVYRHLDHIRRVHQARLDIGLQSSRNQSS